MAKTNRKIVLKLRSYCSYFRLNLKYLGLPYREYIKTVKNGGFCEELLSGNDYRSKRISQMLLVCYSLLNSQNISINNCEKRLVTRTPLTQIKKLQKLHRKRSNNWPKVSFIHNGSEITTGMGYRFKTKSIKSKATFSR